MKFTENFQRLQREYTLLLLLLSSPPMGVYAAVVILFRIKVSKLHCSSENMSTHYLYSVLWLFKSVLQKKKKPSDELLLVVLPSSGTTHTWHKISKYCKPLFYKQRYKNVKRGYITKLQHWWWTLDLKYTRL